MKSLSADCACCGGRKVWRMSWLTREIILDNADSGTYFEWCNPSRRNFRCRAADGEIKLWHLLLTAVNRAVDAIGTGYFLVRSLLVGRCKTIGEFCAGLWWVLCVCGFVCVHGVSPLCLAQLALSQQQRSSQQRRRTGPIYACTLSK